MKCGKLHSISRPQRGAALIVGLILLVVVTVLAISGMNTATTELAIARNDQSAENAFQAAEAGIDLALAQITFDTKEVVPLPRMNFPTTGYSVDTVILPDDITIVQEDGYGGDIRACNFVAEATAESTRSIDAAPQDRDASALHSQAFYTICPPGASQL